MNDRADFRRHWGRLLLVRALGLVLATMPVAAVAQEFSGSAFSPAIEAHPQVRDALDWIDANFDRQVEEWIYLTGVPAPSGHERARAAYVQTELEQAGFEVHIDAKGNVVARWPGTGGGPTIVFAVHLDTVHPLDTDLTVRRMGDTLHAPGVSDNTNGVANMLAVGRALSQAGIRTRGDIIFIGTVEEEIGLKGMHHWLDSNPDVADMVVAVDTGFGSVHYGALGLYWTRYVFRGEGAHTNRSIGQPHPARAVAAAILSIYELDPPRGEGGAIFNVGMLHAGEVFNAIPSEASFTVDLRSVDPVLLDSLDAEIELRVARAAEAEGVVWMKEVANRSEAGGTKEVLRDRLQHPLVQTALHLHDHIGIETRAVASGSTDANAAVVRGIPAITFPKGRGGNAHTLQEWADVPSALPATKLWLLLAVSLSGLDAE
jgi:tripeptide aminopeptidase